MDGERLKELLALGRKRPRGDPGDPLSCLKGINGETLPRGRGSCNKRNSENKEKFWEQSS